MNEENKYEKFESDVLDISDIGGTDIKINPDFYIHKALLKAQECLVKDDARTGFMQFRLMVEHVQVLAESAGMIDTEDYEKRITDFKSESSYIEEEDKILKSVSLANFKLKLIMETVFSSKAIFDKVSL